MPAPERLVIRFCPPVPTWGSQRTFADEYVPRLIAKLTNPTVYTSLSRPSWSHATYVPAANPLCTRGVVNRLWQLLRYQTSFAKQLSADGANVLFCPFNNEGLAWPGRLRQILVVHDLVPLRFPREYPLTWLLWQTVFRSAIRNSTRVICVSEATRRDLIRLVGVDPKRVSVVYNGYTSPAAPLPRNPRKQLLYVASAHSSHKNIATLFEAFARTQLRRTHQLRIVGAPHPRTTPALKARAAKPDLAGSVVFLSHISPLELEAEYASAELFVYPSLCEGFGLPLLEAMARRVPICAARGSAVEEIGADAAVYFDPRDPEDLRATLERLQADPEAQTRLVASGLRRVRDFSWDRSAAECARILEQVALESRP
ncbi:MAG: glycosyltransferase family 1 protein [Opitutaceae bacterium]